MPRRKSLPRSVSGAIALAVFTFVAAASAPRAQAQAQTPAATEVAVQAAAATAARVARVTAPVDDSQLVTLKGNVHPLAQARFDQGAAPVSMPAGRLFVVLSPSAQQKEALREYLDSLQNPASPNYHKWLTPASFGATYGVSDADIAAVSSWLQSQGFKIEQVAASKTIIQFSGSIGQVETAFHTQIHRFLVNGKQHLANTTDPQIPAALAPVIAGLSPLHDFHPHSNARLNGKETWNADSKKFDPQLTLFDQNNNPALFVGPADAATIYNTPNANLNANYSGTTYDGTGVKVGIAGDSNIPLADVANYRALFLDDTNSAHLPTVVVDGNDPGLNGDAIEGVLDNEIIGGIAPGASIYFYTADNTDLDDGLDLAILRAIQDNTVSILNISFGACEFDLGSDGESYYSAVFEQAAAQGITVTVSTGDSGSAGCDAAGTLEAAGGLAVNGLASTPFNIAVGGTDYQLTLSNFGTYIKDTSSGSAPYYGTALGYIPETPWNDSVNTNLLLTNNTAYSGVGAVGGGGGASLAFSKPAFQSALTPTDSARDLPDVSLLGADGAYGALWAFCSDSTVDALAGYTSSGTDCQLTNNVITNSTVIEGIGGTSAASPAFAGMLALVTQSLGSGVRLGQADVTLYKLATSLYSTVYHDVTVGNNSVPCQQGSATSCILDAAGQYFLSGYNAVTGYDEATGLGSINAANMVTNWTTAGLSAATPALTVNGSNGGFSITHGQNVNFKVALSPSAATGDVSINTTSGLANNGNVNAGTLSGGSVTLATNDLPGGSYGVYAYYGGDTTYAGAASNTINVTVSPESSTTALSINITDPNSGNPVSGSSFPYGFYTFADAQPYGNASPVSGGSIIPDGYPTGTVTFQGLSGTPVVGINSIGAAEYPIYTLAPGSYSVTAQYSGDASFNASSSAAQSFTVTRGATQLAVTNSVATTGSTTVTALLETDSVGSYPTGTITATGNGMTFSPTSITQGQLSTGSDAIQVMFTIPNSSLAAGANTITLSYPGDTNYGTSSTTTSITVAATASFSLTPPSSGISISAAGGSGSGTVTLNSLNNFAGAVALTCSVASATGTVPTCTLSPSSVTLAAAGTGTTTLTVNTSANDAGTYTVTVTGTASGGTVASTTVTATIGGGTASFSLAAPSGGITVASPGSSGTGTVTLTSVNGFAGAVNLACSVAFTSSGTAPTCSLIPTSVTLAAGGTGTSTLTVGTTASSATTYPLDRYFAAGGGVALGCVLLFGIPARRRSWQKMLALVCLLVGLGSLGLMGCGGGSSSGGGTTGTPPGSYTVTVTGTASGNVVASTTVSVTVQ